MGSKRGMLEGRNLEAHQWRGCPGRLGRRCAGCRSCNPSVTRAASSASGTRVWSPSTTPCQWWTGASCPRPYEAPRACPSPTGLSACTRSDAYRALQRRGNRSRCSRRVSRSTGKRLCHSRHRRRSNAHLVAEWDLLGAKGGLAGKGGRMMQSSPAKLSPTSLRSFARDLSIAGCIFAVSGSQSSPGIMAICSGAQPCCRPSESAAVSPSRACRRDFFCVIACASSLCTGERAGWPGYGKGSGSVTRPTRRQPASEYRTAGEHTGHWPADDAWPGYGKGCTHWPGYGRGWTGYGNGWPGYGRGWTRLAAHTWGRVRNFWSSLNANAARGLPGAEYKCQCRRQASPPPTAEHCEKTQTERCSKKKEFFSRLTPGWTPCLRSTPSEGWGTSWKDGRTRSSEAECMHEDGVPAPGAAGQGIACHVQRVATCLGVPRPRRFLCSLPRPRRFLCRACARARVAARCMPAVSHACGPQKWENGLTGRGSIDKMKELLTASGAWPPSKESVPEEWEDALLIRFFIGFKRNCDNAADAFQKMLQWREDNDVNEIRKKVSRVNAASACLRAVRDSSAYVYSRCRFWADWSRSSSRATRRCTASTRSSKPALVHSRE